MIPFLLTRLAWIMIVGATLQSSGQPPITVYYFHNHFRCQTCRNMEIMTAETVDTEFIPELEAGTLQMMVVDVEDEGQEHFTADFKFDGPALVLAAKDDNGQVTRWKNLKRIWDLCEKPAAFQQYVSQGIHEFLTSPKSKTAQ